MSTNTVDVYVSDLTGQQTLRLEDVGASTAVAELAGWSKSEMTLPPDVDYLVRDNTTARLLNPEQSVGELALEGEVRLTMQPDAKLGAGTGVAG